MNSVPKIWVVRGLGVKPYTKYTKSHVIETRKYAIQKKISIIGWTDKFPDLTPLSNEEELQKIFQNVFGAKHQRGPNSGLKQLNRFRFEIRLDDIIFMPLKPMDPVDKVVVGQVTQEYHYVDAGLPWELQHRIGVDWDCDFVSRGTIERELNCRLDTNATVYPIKDANSKSITVLKRNIGQGGIPYRETPRPEKNEKQSVWEIDPDRKDRGTAAHWDIQNELKEAVRSAGFEPRSPEGSDPEYDVAWQQGDTAFVAEVKSLTEDNEVRQLRLGLGQVLNYAHLLDWPGVKTVQPVLAVEHPPTAEYWTELCKEHDVILTWPEKFGELFD